MPTGSAGQLLCSTLVDRDQEQAALAAALDRARGGSGATLFLVGEAGLGKSRLAREAETVARRAGMSVLVGRAVAGRTGPFRALAEAFLGVLRADRVALPATLDAFLPTLLGRLVPEWAGDHTPVVEGGDVMVAEGLLRLLRLMGGERGCLLVLEDLHWADPDTLAVVEYLADNLGGEPVVCLATVRSCDPTPGEHVARRLAARRAATVIELGPLGEAAAEALAASCLQLPQLPPEVAALVRERGEGVPFLIEELIATLVAAGTLRVDAGGWVVTAPPGTVVPRSYADAVTARLDALGGEVRRVLEAAAVLGRRFDWTLLPAVTNLNEAVVAGALRTSVDAHFLAAEGSFRFRHALTRDAVLGRLLPPERAVLARAALRVVEAAHPGLPDEWCDLAGELAETAGAEVQAAELLLRAARRALGRGALATAEGMLDRARGLAAGDPARSVEIDETLVATLALAGKVDRVFEVGKDLLESLEGQSAPPSRLAAADLHIARAAVAAARWREAEFHLDRAARARTDLALSARIWALRAQVEIGLGRRAEAEDLARAAWRAAEDSGEPEVACEALEVIGRCARIGDLARGAEAFEKERAIAEEHGLTLWRIRALHQLGTIDLIKQTSIDRLLEAHRLALRAGALGMGLTLDLQILGGLVARNELEEAWQRSTACVEQAHRLGLRHVEAAGRVFRGRIHALRGRRPEVEAEVEMALELAAGDPQTAASAWGMCRGILELVEGRRGPGLRMLDTGMEFARRTVATVTQAFRGLWALERAAAGRDGAAACAEVRASGATVDTLVDGLVLCAEAVVAGRGGNHAAAVERFAHGCSRLESGPWVRQYARRVAAECALEDGWGDPAGWLREALGFFEGDGQQHLATACRALLRRAGVPVPRRGPGVSDVPARLRGLDVTRREAEVLALVREGLSNRGIGERIHISPRTVEKHISSLLLKLGAENRTRLVAVVSSLGP